MNIKQVIEELFNTYKFKKLKDYGEIAEFYNTNLGIDDFYVVSYLNEGDELSKLNDGLENDFTNDMFFQSIEEGIEAVEKNTSVIYLVEVKDVKTFMELNENEVYTIEESPYYMKKYILPYTEEQLDFLLQMKNNENTFIELMKQIIENQSMYKKRLVNMDNNDLYSFVLRLYAKLPFTCYDVKPQERIGEIEKKIRSEIFKDKNSLLLQNIYEQFEQERFSYEDLKLVRENIEVSEEKVNEQWDSFFNIINQEGDR